jgi:hypothetical protein
MQVRQWILKVLLMTCTLAVGLSARGEDQPAATSTTPKVAAQKLTAEKLEREVVVRVGGEVFTSYKVAGAQKYPYLFPVNGPRTGKSVTTETSEPYPHHHSVFLGCDRVNGGNYWQEGLERGRIASKEAKVAKAEGDEVVIEDRCVWERPGAPAPMEDRRRITISAPSADLRLIDVDVTLTALIDVRVEPTNHSLFAVRVAKELSPAGGGALVDSEGRKGEKETFGKKAAWCDFSGTRGGAVEGIAILDHPKNPWSPCPWFTRDYGFISPTPMQWIGREGWRLEKGKSVRLRYLVVVHAGDAEAAGLRKIQEEWARR